MDELHSKENIKKVEAATKLAVDSLEHYGDPTMELAELRALLNKQLKGISLTDFVIKERESGW